MIAENFEISVIKNLESQFKQIIHLADIHIRNKSDRDDEYRSVFENLNLKIRSDNQLKKNEILIIICGDIFHDARKDRKLSPNAIQMFKNLISKLNVEIDIFENCLSFIIILFVDITLLIFLFTFLFFLNPTVSLILFLFAFIFLFLLH